MKFTLLLLSSVLAEQDVHPIQAVLNLIEQEIKDAKRLQEEADIEQQKNDRDCQNTHDSLTDSIADHRQQQEEQRTEKEAQQATVDALEAQISELQDNIADNNDNQAQIDSTRGKDNEAYVASRDTLKDTVAAVKECITLLKAGGEHSMFLQVKATEYAELYFSAGDAAVVRQALQKPADPETRKFDSKLGKVVELFEKLLLNMEQKLRARETEEQNGVNAHALSMKALEGENTSMTTLKGEKEDAAGDARSKRDDAEAAEKDHKSTADAESDELRASQRSCAETRATYEKVSNERSEENEAMLVATEILEQVTGIRAKHEAVATFFLQLPVTVQDKAFSLLRSVAKKTHSTALARLAAELKVAKGPFDQVLNMVQKLIDQLKKEQRDDDAHNDWCENEWKVSTDAEEDKTNKRDALNAKADTADQNRALNKEAWEKSEKELQSQIELKANTIKSRTADKENNHVSIEDAEKALAAITDALSKLNAWKNGSEGNQDKGQKVIDLLEKTQKHYMQMLNDVKNAEEEADLAHVEFLAEDARAVATINATIDGAKNKDQRLNSKISTLQERSSATAESLREVKQYKDDLAKACGKGKYEADNKYEERKTNRGLEIDGLQQAKEFLANYRAPKSFLQRL